MAFKRALTRAPVPLLLFLPGMTAIAAICLGEPFRASPPTPTRFGFRKSCCNKRRSRP